MKWGSVAERVWAALRPIVHLALFGLALYAVDRVLGEYDPGAMAAALRGIPAPAVALALLTTALGYASLIGHDWVALRILGRQMSLRAMAVPSFVSFAVSASAPGSMVAGGGVRYRMFRPLGIGGADAAAMSVLDAVTWLLGLLALAGATFAVGAARMPGQPAAVGRLLGIGCLAIVGGYFVLAALHRAPLRVRRFVLPLPTPRLALVQLGLSLADWLLSSGALYVLIRSVADASYLRFLTTFLAAQVGSLLLPVPGGLGVFEALVLLLAPRAADRPSILAALLLYRTVYYLIPLLIAGVLALRMKLGAADARPVERLRHAIRDLAPHALAAITFLSGALLFLTGAIPRDRARVSWLLGVLPPALVDASQFLGSVVGAGLLIVAWGLERRSRAAYRVAVLLFGWGILLATTRSSDSALSFGMAAVLVLLWLARSGFTGPRAEATASWGTGWAFAVGAALLVSLWVGLWSQRWAGARSETWWHFTLFGAAPAHVRAALGAAIALFIAAVVRLMGRGVRPVDAPPPT